MKSIFRGFTSITLTWFVVSLLLPFIFGGMTSGSLSRILYMPFIFLIGLIPLAIGSFLWLMPLYLPRFRGKRGILYHFWIAFGSAIALWFYVELQFSGDPPPPSFQYWTPSLISFPLALAFSLSIDRICQNKAEQGAAANRCPPLS